MAEAGAEAKTEVLRLEAHFDEERGKSRTPKVLSVPELAKFERNLVTEPKHIQCTPGFGTLKRKESGAGLRCVARSFISEPLGEETNESWPGSRSNPSSNMFSNVWAPSG